MQGPTETVATVQYRLTSYIKNFITSNSTFVRVIKTSAAITPMLFLLISTIIQSIQPEHNPLQDAISMLVWGRYGWLQTVIFYLLAFSVMILVIKLIFKQGTRKKFRVGVFLLALQGASLIIVGLFPTELPGTPLTLRGLIHLQASAVGILSFPAACFLLAPDLRVCLSQKWLSLYTRVAGVMSILLIGVISVLVLADYGWVGMLERFIIINGVTWVQIINIHAL